MSAKKLKRRLERRSNGFARPSRSRCERVTGSAPYVRRRRRQERSDAGRPARFACTTFLPFRPAAGSAAAKRAAAPCRPRKAIRIEPGTVVPKSSCPLSRVSPKLLVSASTKAIVVPPRPAFISHCIPISYRPRSIIVADPASARMRAISDEPLSTRTYRAPRAGNLPDPAPLGSACPQLAEHSTPRAGYTWPRSRAAQLERGDEDDDVEK